MDADAFQDEIQTDVSQAVFLAVSDPTRRAILDLLLERERSVGELTPLFPMTQQAVSKHLRVLLEAGVVTQRREGRHQIYSLNAEPLLDVARWIQRYEAFWHEKSD